MSPTQPIGWVSWHAAIPICSFYGRSGYDRRLDHKSRMKRELPVRIREGLGVQFPRATRLATEAERDAAEIALYPFEALGRPAIASNPAHAAAVAALQVVW